VTSVGFNERAGYPGHVHGLIQLHKSQCLWWKMSLLKLWHTYPYG